MAATQEELYEALEHDAALSWSERDLPQRVRTKHVHSLHPYLGKYVPQLVEELLRRHVPAGGRVLDPFAGSGTTLVQALESGLRARRHRHRRVQLPAHARQDGRAQPVRARARAARRARALRARGGDVRTGDAVRPQLVRTAVAAELLRFRSLIGDYESADVLRVVLARAARSARLTTHFDLDFPKQPQLEPYWCHKHRRECRPVDRAGHFVRRYTLDTLARLKEFARLRGPGAGRGDPRRRARGRPAGPVRRGRHLAAVSGADRLPRAASLRLRAAGARRPPRARARRGCERHVPPALRPTSTGSPRCSARRPRRCAGAAAS